MRVIFRVDASLKIGIGHVMRCLVIAQALKNNNAHVEFICRDFKGNLIEKIRSEGFYVHTLLPIKKSNYDSKLSYSRWLGVTQDTDAKDCEKILKDSMSDWIIVDHYGIDEDWQTYLNKYFKKLMVIDDLADRKHICDVLLDQTFNRNKSEYISLVPPICSILTGARYALLRPEFALKRRIAFDKRKQKFSLQNILLSLGGYDPNNLAEKILQKLLEISWIEPITINLILGYDSSNKERIEKMIVNCPIKVNILESISNISELMIEADIAIGAGGGTNLERCCMGLPSFVLITSENQKESSLNLQKAGAIVVKESYSSIVNEISKLYSENHINMNKISKNAFNICDGNGIQRVVGIIKS